MSESLRDLVVSLSLKTENFTRNIKSVNKQIQEAESYFKLAAAGVEGFENTTEGLSTKLSTLERRLQLQKEVVTQYERALEQATSKLTECYDRQTDYAQRLDDARQRQAALGDAVSQATNLYEQYKSELGETDDATIAAKANMEAAQEEYRVATEAVKTLSGQQDALQRATQNAADAVSTQQTQLNRAQAAVWETETAIRGCNDALRLSQTNWQAAGERMRAADTAVTSLGKQMQLAQSRFRLASVGIKDVDTNAGALSAKLVMLREKLELQNQTIAQYEAKLAAAKEQLQAAQQANDPDKIREATDAVTDAETALNNARAALQDTEAAIRETNSQLRTAESLWTAAGKSLTSFSKSCDSISKTTGTIGRLLSTYVTTPVTALGTAAMKSSIEFESAFTGVRKTVDASEEEFARLESSVKRMSTELAASTTDISEVMEVAGQLGIQTDALEDFTRVMIDLGNSTDIVAQDAGSTLAKFANIMGMDQSLFENLGSTLVDLGNNYATTESAIMEMSLRLAGAGKQVGLSEAQILGFAAALSSVGIEAQMGGSALSKALIKMEVAAATGGQELTDFSQVCGLTEEQFRQMWESDPAAVFQKFIEGLAQMDDEGISAIAVLEEIGISEIRLRDTMLRAVNATELFSNTQETANKAWQENTALATEAGKRYATTESQLTNLKNKAMLFVQQIGDDLNPLLRSLIDGADELIEKFMDMDEAQRLQIIQTVAFAAAIGPAFLAVSKLAKGLSTITGGIGKFATAVGKAGGGFSGFMSVLSKSPAVWFAVAAAVIAGTVALVDYVSGAKQAREALEGMKETAEEWKETAADTFYNQSNAGLSFFGMSTDDFKSEGDKVTTSGREWLSGLIEVWTDGKKETDAIVNDWAEDFKTGSDTIRASLTELKTGADESGYTGLSEQMQTDLDALDSMDAEIARLLKKRQSKQLTDDDKIRLRELIDAREAIQIKYNLVPDTGETEGFDTIRKKLEAEVARAQARGQDDADITVYENAVVAAAQGLAAINSEIDANYDKEYALIQLISDSSERETALANLNSRYSAERKQAALEYAALLADITLPVFRQDNIQQAATDIDLLTQKLREYSAASESDKPQILDDLNHLTAGMDESSLVEYIGLLTQIQSLLDSGLTEDEVQSMFPEIDFSTALDQIASIQSFLNGRETLLPGLSSMFGEALPDEMITMTTDLDMTGAQTRWDEFAANPGAITTDAIIAGYADAENAVKPEIIVDAFISGYTETPEGADKSQLTPNGLIAYVEKYAEVTNDADVSGLTPEIATAFVAGYQELATGADVSELTPGEIVAYVTSYAEKEGVDVSGLKPEAVTAFVLAYEEVTGGALTTALTPTDIAAIVTKYLVSSDVDMSKITDAQVEAVVSAYAEATVCDKSALKAEVQAQITAYVEAENAEKPSYIKSQVSITGYDLTAYQQFVARNPVTVNGIVRLGEVFTNPSDALEAENVNFWQDGVEIPTTMVPTEMLTPDKVAVLDEDGTMHILLTTELTGDKEVIENLRTDVAEVDSLGVTELGKAAGLLPATIMDRVQAAVDRLKSYEKTKDYNWIEKFWATLCGESTDKDALNQSMLLDFDPSTLASITSYVSEVVTAIENGDEIAQEDYDNLQSIIEFLNALELTGVGENVTAGIGEAMAAAGWETDAESVASNLENALKSALVIQSPSQRMHPVGENVSAGIGEGAAGFDFSADALAIAGAIESAITAAIAANPLNAAGTAAMTGLASGMTAYGWSGTLGSVSFGIRSAANTAISASTLRSVGVNAMSGLAAGIRAGQSSVVSAMRSAAQSAVTAAKTALKIKSPSRVFRDEIGAMTMKGFGQGVLAESKTQARIIRNAARYLTDEAREGAILGGSTTNNRTYDQSSTITLTGNTFSIRDEQDIYALATEIATLTRRQQRGKGLRMA